MPLRLAFVICLTVALWGCTPFPDLDSALSDGARDAPYPALLPVETLTARAADPQITPGTGPGIEARVASLRARAARLRGSVIDNRTHQRLSAGVTGN